MPDLHAAERTVSAGATPPVAVDQLTRHRSYQELVERLRDLVHRHVPPGATVAVVSKGDPDLVSLVGRQGWHFPQDDTGGYVGYHPRDSASAIEGLEDLRSRGADFLVLPATSNWWLDYYGDFASHLRGRYDVLVEQPSTGAIYALRQGSRPNAASTAAGSLEGQLELHRHALLAQQITDLTAALVPTDQSVCIVQPDGTHPHQLEGRVTIHLRVDEPGAADPDGPADELIAQLDSHRRRGVCCLIVPQSAFAWWTLHVEFRLHVEREYRCITQQANVCFIYELNSRGAVTS